jgi:hypothetical protein
MGYAGGSHNSLFSRCPRGDADAPTRRPEGDG